MIKEHTNQIPVLGSTGTGFQGAPSERTNFWVQQLERYPRALSRARRMRPRNPHSQDREHNRGNDQGNRTYLDFFGKLRNFSSGYLPVPLLKITLKHNNIYQFLRIKD